MWAPRLFSALFVCASTLGCSTEPVIEAVEAPAEAAGRYGLVVLTQQFGEPGVSVSAQLMEFEGLGLERALHALAAPEQAWLAGQPVSIGTCRLLTADAVSPDADAWVDLIDVGDVSIHPPAPLDEPLIIAPRELPPLLAAVDGVVYDADAPERLPYLAGGSYRVRADGLSLGGSVDAPAPVWIEGYAHDAGALEVWVGGGAGALVLLSRSAGSRTIAVACRGADDHAVRVPVEALRHLGPGPAELAAIRVERARLTADEFDGHVLFVTRDATELVLPEEPR